MNKWDISVEIRNLRSSTSEWEIGYEFLFSVSCWTASIFNARSVPCNKYRTYDTRHSSLSFDLITLDLCVMNFELLCTEIEASFPALIRDLEQICPRPSTLRGLKEVHIHKVKRPCTYGMWTLQNHLTQRPRTRGCESAVPNLYKGIITLTFSLALKSGWEIIMSL
jgi:hypothetical protein